MMAYSKSSSFKRGNSVTVVKSLSPKASRLYASCVRARSLRGKRLSPGVITVLCDIQEQKPNYLIEIGSGYSLERNLSFFRNFASALEFYDSDGRQFSFSGKAKPVMLGETFIALSYNEEFQKIKVYACFQRA